MKSSLCIVIIWLCFTCIFWGLSYYHYQESQNIIPPVKWEAEGPGAKAVLGLSTGYSETKKFAQGVSDTMIERNKNDRRQNQIAA